MQPFDLEVWYGERVAVLGSQRLRQVALPAAARARRQRPRRRAPAGRRRRDRRRSRTPAWPGSARGCGPAGSCRPTSTPSSSAARCSRSCTAATSTATGMGREPASRVLDRYELAHAAEQTFESLSGGQQARFQILLLELSGATLLLLDEPTDNLDVAVAEALEEGLDAFEGTVRRRHPRPVVRPRLRPVPGVRRRRDGLRVGRAGVGRDPPDPRGRGVPRLTRAPATSRTCCPGDHRRATVRWSYLPTGAPIKGWTSMSAATGAVTRDARLARAGVPQPRPAPGQPGARRVADRGLGVRDSGHGVGVRRRRRHRRRASGGSSGCC